MVQWQNFPVAFGGVDTKTDPKKVIPGKLLSLQNGVFSSPGQVRKRYGYSALGTSTAGGGGITAGAGLASFQSEFLLFDGLKLYSYSSAASAWAQKGNAASVIVSSRTVTRNTYAQTAADSATIGNIQVFAWEDSRGSARYSVQDTSTGVFLVQDALLLTNGTRPKVIAFGTTFLIFVVNSGGSIVQYYSISSSTPTSITNLSTLVSTLNTGNSNYDVTAFGGKVYVGWVHSTASTIGLGSITTAGGAFTTTSQAVTGQPVNVSLMGDSGNSRISVIFSTSTDVQIYVRNSSTLAAVSNATIETIASVANVSGVVTSSTSAQVYYTVSASLSYNYVVRQSTLTNYTPGSASVFLRSVGLAAKPFLYNSTPYVQLAFSSPLQPTYFVADSSGNLVAKLFSGSGGGLPTRSVLAESVGLGGAIFRLSCLVVDLLTTQPGTTSLTSGSATPLYTLTGVNTVDLNFQDTVNGFQSATLASNLHIGGGFLSMYDGGTPVEHGFHLYPEGVLSYVCMTGGSMGVPSGVSSATFEASAAYEWTDNQGQVHQSSPSVPSAALLVPASSTNVGLGFSGGAFAVGNTSTLSTAASITGGIAFSGGAGGTYSATTGSIAITGCATTSGSKVISIPTTSFGVTGGADQITDYLYEGMLVTGSGIASNTYLAVNETLQLQLNNNATATSTNVTLTFSPAQMVICASALNSSNVQIFPHRVKTIGVKCNGTSTYQVSSTSGLKVGMTLLAFTASGNTSAGVIQSIDTTRSSVTTNATFSRVTAGFINMGVMMMQTNVTTTAGGANITGVNAAMVGFAQSTLATTPSPAWITGTTIPSTAGNPDTGSSFNAASGSTITLNSGTGVTASSTATIIIWWPGSAFMQSGNVLLMAGFPAATTVLAKVDDLNFTVSNPSTSTLSLAAFITNTWSVVHVVPTLRLTGKQSARSPVSVVTYRTPGNGSVFYRSSSITSPMYNDATIDSVQLGDNTPDTNLVSAPTLYTTGNVLESQPPNAVSLVTPHKSRLFALDSTSPNTIWYSKQVVSGTPLQFSGFQTLTLDPLGGNVTGMASMDDKLIIFKSTSIYYLVGDGPDATGANNNFSAPILIPTDAGCVNPRSVVVTPMGVMFHANKGLSLLTRSLEVQYIGKDIEGALGSNTVTGARLLQSPNQVRFTLSNGTALVFDLLEGQWSTFTNHQCIDVGFYGGNFSMLQSSGVVLTETPGLYSDNGSYIPLSLTTSWLQLAGVQGFQRIRKALILGDYESGHTLTAQVAYDFVSTPVQTDAIASTSAPSTAYQFRVFMARQKCEAIQLTLTDAQNGTLGEGVRLSGITLEVGVKKGTNKLPAANSVG